MQELIGFFNFCFQIIKELLNNFLLKLRIIIRIRKIFIVVPIELQRSAEF